ncbi:MAG: hypothetical protein V7L01_19615 [Nostoc sp.]|uniref:hypothetical protein n=1 Tax=Nostoc sp. TaxID=1180 RepID=UPI002FF62D87
MAIIQGTSGNDNLTGTQVNDQVYGNGGDDILTGGAGNDNLVGGSGNDNLTGGIGRDTYVLQYSGGGIDRIPDFSVNDDILKVTTSTISSSNYLIGTQSSLTNYQVIEDGAIDSTKFATRSLTLGSSNISQSSSIFTYNASTGALFYSSQQLAWLPPNLNWNGVVVVPSAAPPNNESLI